MRGGDKRGTDDRFADLHRAVLSREVDAGVARVILERYSARSAGLHGHPDLKWFPRLLFEERNFRLVAICLPLHVCKDTWHPISG